MEYIKLHNKIILHFVWFMRNQKLKFQISDSKVLEKFNSQFR